MPAHPFDNLFYLHLTLLSAYSQKSLFQPMEFQPMEFQPMEFQPIEFQPMEFQPMLELIGSEPVLSSWLGITPVLALFVLVPVTAA